LSLGRTLLASVQILLSMLSANIIIELEIESKIARGRKEMPAVIRICPQ